MFATVNLYSTKKGELNDFLSRFYNTDLEIYNNLNWEKKYTNPIELAEIIGVYIDNSDLYNLKMLICIDKNLFITITKDGLFPLEQSAYNVNCETISNSPFISFRPKFILSFSSVKTLSLHNFFTK